MIYNAIEYGTTADNLIAARFDTSAFVMKPIAGDRFILATAWCPRGSFADWTVETFYGHDGRIADEAEFRARVEEEFEHHREKGLLDRPRRSEQISTPWGMSQDAVTYAPGITYYATPGHGGFCLAPNVNLMVHHTIRAKDGWYEHDLAWAAVAFTFGALFTTAERKDAWRTIADRYPATYEALVGLDRPEPDLATPLARSTTTA